VPARIIVGIFHKHHKNGGNFANIRLTMHAPKSILSFSMINQYHEARGLLYSLDRLLDRDFQAGSLKKGPKTVSRETNKRKETLPKNDVCARIVF